MKIYIITFSFSGNNGAVLQMFALQRYLVSLGCDVKVVDYQPYWLEKKRKDTPLSIKECIINFYRSLGRKKLQTLLKDNIIFTKVCRDYRDIESLDQPDYYFAGSDQIWNPEITGGIFDKGYFMEFSTTAGKVFYGASIGVDVINQETAKTISKKLDGSIAVSVREEGLRDALTAYRTDVISVMDPVFLIDVDDFRNMMVDVSTEKYVLIYQMSDDARCYRLATRLSHKYGYKVIDYGKIRKRECVNKTVIGEAPNTFLGYLANAEYVVTNSFHGVALSVKFQKQFYAVRLNNRQSRISSLLERIGLESRIVDDADGIKLTNIDYLQTDDVICAEIEKSRNFIKTAIGIDKGNLKQAYDD